MDIKVKDRGEREGRERDASGRLGLQAATSGDPEIIEVWGGE